MRYIYSHFDSRFHNIKVCLVAGIGFFIDGYGTYHLFTGWPPLSFHTDSFAIDIASVMIGSLYGHVRGNHSIKLTISLYSPRVQEAQRVLVRVLALLIASFLVSR
jgi:hypothetical protein